MKIDLKHRIRILRKEIRYLSEKPRRILFDHLPKCAGSTLRTYLSFHYPSRVTFETHGREYAKSVLEFRSLPEKTRHGFHLVAGHDAHGLMGHVHPDTITVTVFRDPIDRIVSHYFYVKRYTKHYLHEQVMQSKMTLEEYATSGLSTELRNFYTTHFTGRSIEEVEADPSASVGLAADAVFGQYNIIGFQDNMQGVADALKKVAHLARKYKGEVWNKTDDRLGIQAIPERTRMVIADVNALDVRLFELIKSQSSESKPILAQRH